MSYMSVSQWSGNFFNDTIFYQNSPELIEILKSESDTGLTSDLFLNRSSSCENCVHMFVHPVDFNMDLTHSLCLPCVCRVCAALSRTSVRGLIELKYSWFLHIRPRNKTKWKHTAGVVLNARTCLEAENSNRTCLCMFPPQIHWESD